VSAFFENRIDGRDTPFARWYRGRTEEWEAAARHAAVEVLPDIFSVHPILLSTTNVSIPKETFLRAGGFDAALRKPGVEDMEFGLRLGRLGIPVYRTSRACPIHCEARGSLEEFCERQRAGASVTVRLLQRYPETCGTIEDADLGRVNGPLRLGGEPLTRSVKKLAKGALAHWPLSGLAFATAHRLERFAPESRVLARLYEALGGAFVQRGWREGLREHVGAGTP
jgi:GT2 family glycosyltransferase